MRQPRPYRLVFFPLNNLSHRLCSHIFFIECQTKLVAPRRITSGFLLFELDIHALARQRKLAPFNCGNEVYNDAFLILQRGASTGAASRVLRTFLVVTAEVFQALQLEHATGKLRSGDLAVDVSEKPSGL